MTKEEIIDNIARLNSQTWRDREEVRMEIGKLLAELKKSLEQQPSDCKIFGNKENCFGGAAEKECNHCDYKQTAEQQPSDDCVSRTQAIEWVENLRQMDKCFGNYEDDYFPLSEVIDRLKNVPPVTPTHGKCKDCKYWKDSDGVYRRGMGVESKCPINNSRVFEGTFYCADYEKRGSKNE